jgi:hypothetical protein
MKKFIFPLLVALLSLCPRASAQFIGDVGLQTVTAVLANNTTCTGGQQSFVVPNLGQISHQASAASSAASFTMEIDGNDGIASYRMSNPQVSFTNGATQSYIVQGAGYYSRVTVVVSCTASATFSLTYAGAQAGFSNIIGPPSGSTVNLTSALTGNVQGTVAQQQSAAAVNPVIAGGLQPAINSGLLTAGVDNFNIRQTSIPNNGAGTFNIGLVPTPTAPTETAVAFDAAFPDLSSGTAILAPWVCQPVAGATSCQGGVVSVSTLANATSGQLLRRSYSQAATGGGELTSIVLFAGTAAFRQGISGGSNTAAFGSATLSGSTMMGAVQCSGTTPCTITSVTDTQGNTWLPLTSTFRNGTQISGLLLFVSPNLSTAAANTVTFTVGSGAIANATIVELTGTSPSQLVNPAIGISADPIGNEVVRLDAQAPNQFACNVTLSTLTTTQCQAAPTTVAGVNARLYVTDFQINTTAGGTTSSVQLKTGTGTNCGTGTLNLSAITYSTVTASPPVLTSVMGARTPLVAPTQNAVCVTQAGGAAGTATVEIRGFIAP